MNSISKKFTQSGFFPTLAISIMLFGCGGGGGGNNSTSTIAPTAAEVAAITPIQLASYVDAQIIALGTNIKYLSDSSLNALSSTTGPTNGPNSVGQIESITAAQISTFSPAQIRMIGAAGPGGSIITSQIARLNSGAWAALVSNSAQVSAITGAETASLFDGQITAMGNTIGSMSNSALNALTSFTNGAHPIGQIESITATQISAFTPAQIRMIGAAGPGGSITTSQIASLNSGAWAALVSNPAQVSAITGAEIATLSDGEITAMGSTIGSLSNSALNAMSSFTNGAHPVGQIESITAAQISVFTPAQIRMIGAAGPGGSVTTSQIASLNSGAWSTLVSSSAQVSSITGAEIATLFDGQITAMASNFNMLTNSALSALSYFTGGAHPVGQIESITSAQIVSLTPSQIGVIASINSDKGVAFLNAGAFQSLTPSQISILTPTQKSFFSTTQHSACGC